MICVCICNPSHEVRLQQACRYPMTELRIDMCQASEQEIRQYGKVAGRWIATCHSKDLERSYGLLSAALESGADWVDIDCGVPEDFRRKIMDLAHCHGAKVILSYHNTECTPDDETLCSLIETMFRDGADIAKVAAIALSMNDSARLMSLYEKYDRLISIGMGEEGVLTRFRATSLGAPFTYAHPDDEARIVPGQLPYSYMAFSDHDSQDIFGSHFRVEVFGCSHSPALGCVIYGCPAGLELKVEDFKADLDRRRPGAVGTTARNEEDVPCLESGVRNGVTTGSPLRISFRNSNYRDADYDVFHSHPRPGHADMVLRQVFGSSFTGGMGKASGRMTVAIVAAGVVAKKILAAQNIAFEAVIETVGGCKDWGGVLEQAVREGDSLGGTVSCRITGVPVGMGHPFFDSVESVISHMMFSIPAVNGIEFGAGFEGAGMRGSEFNDPIIDAAGTTSGNNAGGINGGYSNGNDIFFRVSVKPASSISKSQNTFDFSTGSIRPLSVKGRHDCCIALRMPVIVEAAAAIALADC